MADGTKITVEQGNTSSPDKAPKKAAVKTSVERWWSQTDPRHMIVVELQGAPAYVEFKDYSLVLNLDDPKEKEISQQLHLCGREGKDIFVIGDKYAEHQHGDKTALMATLRTMSLTPAGVEKIRGMFTQDELVNAGLPRTTDDVDSLILLALDTKSIQSRISPAKKHGPDKEEER